MSLPASSGTCAAEEFALVSRQIGRPPRDPWRVATRCQMGFPTVIASPSVLADGSRFPTLFWLTCPHLIERVGEFESAGEAALWAARASRESALAEALCLADLVLAEMRAEESGGVDACAGTGVAGQREPLAVKCLHAHVALALAGVADPIGQDVLARVGRECSNRRCATLIEPGGGAQVADSLGGDEAS